jgi:hypothetical protein
MPSLSRLADNNGFDLIFSGRFSRRETVSGPLNVGIVQRRHLDAVLWAIEQATRIQKSLYGV